MSQHDGPIRILFVCMGNICRSPLAEGVFQHLAEQNGVADHFEIDSAGTGGWHAGELADPRMRATAESHGITLTSRARQIKDSDWTEFDLVVCMDQDNQADVLAAGAPVDRVSLLLDFDSAASVREVPDPYYGGDDGFETVYQLVHSACTVLLEQQLQVTARELP